MVIWKEMMKSKRIQCRLKFYYFYSAKIFSQVYTWLIWFIIISQLDIRGDPYGLLAAHPLAPLISLHHLDYLDPMFPGQTQIDSVKTLMKAYRADPRRILQQCFCYDKKRKWSISIAWGYTLQIYPFMLAAKDLQTPMQTFKTWRSWSNGPFTFNTRPVSTDLCQHPIVYFLDRVEEVGESGTRTSYEMHVSKEKKCDTEVYKHAMAAVQRVVVSSLKMDRDHWKKVEFLSLHAQDTKHLVMESFFVMWHIKGV